MQIRIVILSIIFCFFIVLVSILVYWGFFKPSLFDLWGGEIFAIIFWGGPVFVILLIVEFFLQANHAQKIVKKGDEIIKSGKLLQGKMAVEYRISKALLEKYKKKGNKQKKRKNSTSSN